MKRWHWFLAAFLALGAIGRLMETPEDRAKQEAAQKAQDAERETERKERERVGSHFSAEVMAEKFLKKQLKSPATAEVSGVKSELAGDSWVVTGLVDAQNSFGAMLRYAWVCKVRHVEGDTWSLEHACTISE